MTRVETSIVIKAPPEKVWEMLALDRWSEWLGRAFLQTEGMKFTSEVNTPEDKYRVGASAQSKMVRDINLRLIQETFTVTESLKNEKITYRCVQEESGNEFATITLVLEPIEDGTRLTYAVSFEMPWGVFGKFIEKVGGRRLGERGIEKSLEKLKSILEK